MFGLFRRFNLEKVIGRGIWVITGLATAYGFLEPFPAWIRGNGLSGLTSIGLWATSFLGGVVFFLFPLFALGVPYLTIRMLLDRRKGRMEE